MTTEKEMSIDELKSKVIELTKTSADISKERDAYRTAFETIVDRCNTIVGTVGDVALKLQIVNGELAKVSQAGFVEKRLPEQQPKQVQQR